MLFDFDDLLPNFKICIYGTGKRSLDFKKFIETYRKDIKIISFIDSFETGILDGLKIISLENIQELNEEYDLIIIASSFWPEIKKSLDNLKINKYKIIASDFAAYLLDLFNDDFSNNYLSKNPDKIKLNSEKVIKLLSSYRDKKLYENIVNLRIGIEKVDKIAKYSINNYKNSFNQYFDFINKQEIKTVIEGGVCDASSTYLFIKNFENLKFLYGFDPFYKNVENISFLSMLENNNKYKIYDEALWKESTSLNFLENSSSSMLVEHSEADNLIKVNTVSIDDFIYHNKIKKVDYIKFDIEGSELAALQGAKSTLMNHRPQLAISIYHKEEDLYEIPLFLNDILENYTYHISLYTPTLREIIWYAIPNEIANM